MSCINCDVVPKRINNIFKDDELKDKFENLTGISILQNLFICDTCSNILIESHAFKEKCTQTYYRDYIKHDPCRSSDKIVKTEVYEQYQEIQQLDLSRDEIQLIQEEHLEEEEIEEYEEEDDKNDITYELDPLQSPSKKRYHAKYSVKDKLRAMELAEQSSNRQAAKLLSIDESCIRKWRQQKDRIVSKDVDNSNSIKSPQESQEMECDTIEVEVFQTEEIDDTKRPVRTRKSYTSGEKLEAISFAEVSGNRQAAKVYKIDESCIRKWRNQKEMIMSIHEERGTKRKPNLRFPKVESRLKAFVQENLEEGIVLKPSEIKSESIKIANELNIKEFKGTSSYIFKFMERYHFPSSRARFSTPRIIKKSLSEEPTDINVDTL